MFAQRIVAEDRDAILEQVDRARREGGDFDAFARIRPPDGQLRDVHFRGSMVTAPGRAGAHLIGICQDLTDVRGAGGGARRGGRALPLGVRARAGRDGAGGARRALHARQRGDGASSSGRPGDAARVHRRGGHPPRRHAGDAPRRCGGWRPASCPSGTPRSATCARAARSAGARCGRCCCPTPRGEPHCLALVRDVTEQRRAERRRAAAHGVLRGHGRRPRPARGAAGARARPSSRSSAGSAGACGCSTAASSPRGGVAARRRPAPERPPSRPELRIVIPVVDGADTLGVLSSRSTAGRLGASSPGSRPTLGVQFGEFIVRKRAEEQRLHEALHDPLTGLPNRVLFFDRLDHAIRRQRREHAPLAVLFLDFDGFKAVNDRFGHAGGDEVLRRAAGAVCADAARGGHGRAVRRRRARRALRAHGRRRGRRRDRRADPRAAAHADRRRRRGGHAVGEHRDLRRAGRGRRRATSCCAPPTRRCTRPRPAGRAATSSRSDRGPYHCDDPDGRRERSHGTTHPHGHAPATRRSPSGPRGTPRRWSGGRGVPPRARRRLLRDGHRGRGPARGRSPSCRSTPSS